LLLLTTDGLHGVVAEEEIRQALKDSTLSLQAKCERLLAAAHEAGSPDNVTMVLMTPA
jgi:serine/threonine protein phosphatase PrpC